MLSGEWSVLTPGNPCIVFAVDRYAQCSLERVSDGFCHISTTHGSMRGDFDGKQYVWNVMIPELKLTCCAFNIFCRYCHEMGVDVPLGLRIELDSDDMFEEVDGKQKKIGLGSSAASTVSLLSCLLALLGEVDVHVLYKLAYLAHNESLENKGSGFDIAAAISGGVLLYKRPNKDWLEENKDRPLQFLLDNQWPGLYMKELPNWNIPLSVCWTGTSSLSKVLLKAMHAFEKKHQEQYDTLIHEISHSTIDAYSAWNTRQISKLRDAIVKNHKALAKLDAVTGIGILSPELKKAIKIANDGGSVAKLSGAGGGDCLIALSKDMDQNKKMVEQWRQKGFFPLSVQIGAKGVHSVTK